MYVRNYLGKIVEFDQSKYKNEEHMYRALWKILYNIEISITNCDTNKELIDFIST
jgi:hypothetical protein